MREYDLFVPLFYNDGRSVEVAKFQSLQKWILDRFDGITIFPQPNKGTWRMGDVTYQDEIVIYRVLAPKTKRVRSLFLKLKEKLKVSFQQEKFLIVERNVRVV